MRSLTSDFPAVKLELHKRDTTGVLDILEVGTIDVGIVRTPFMVGEFECHYAAPEPMIAVMPEGMRCGKDPSRISLEELSTKPIVIDCHFGKIIHDIFVSRGLKLFMACMTEDVRTTSMWASRGMGVGVVPRSCLTETELQEAKAISCEKLTSISGTPKPPTICDASKIR